jgi:hypothetical protein
MVAQKQPPQKIESGNDPGIAAAHQFECSFRIPEKIGA